jgi:NTE family protein
MADATTNGQPKTKTEIGLVLQGGGALGAYEWGAIQALFEVMAGRQKEGREIVLRAVTGVSIGAINAACVVGSAGPNDAQDRLAALWTEFMIGGLPFVPQALNSAAALCWVPHFYRFSPGLTYLYDTHELLPTLSRHVDFAALNGNATAFVITATDVESGELVQFANQKVGQIDPTTIKAEHILASGSLPPQFPWTQIGVGEDARSYWDGGIVDNTPLGYAIDAFSPGEVDRALVIMNLFPETSTLPDTFTHVNDRLDQLRFGNRLLQDSANARRITDLVETVESLDNFIKSGPNPLPGPLQQQVDEALKLKSVRTIEITLGPKTAFSDEYGFRDFSADGIKKRRYEGHRQALDILHKKL